MSAQADSQSGRFAPNRSADPYADLVVIDARAPRVDQEIIAVAVLLGVAFGWPLAWALAALQFLATLTLGRRYSIGYLTYFELVRPRLGEGPLEDSRPRRVAPTIGVVFLGAAAISWWLGLEAVGTVLAAMVGALALLAAVTGYCVGCALYRIDARLRGVIDSTERFLESNPLPAGVSVA